MQILWKRSDYTDQDIMTFQDLIDNFFQKYVKETGVEGITNYIHKLASGHIKIHLWRTKKEDVEKINTRVVGPNLILLSLEELNGSDITYACATNADRILIFYNIFANILKQRHPKEDQDFNVPQETIIIKGNF